MKVGDILISTRAMGGQWLATLSVLDAIEPQTAWRQVHVASAPSETDARWGVIRQWMHVDD